MSNYPILEQINTPEDIKSLDAAQTEALCAELRKKIIETVAHNGGHLSSNLGVVELTVALHKLFHSPEDEIIFDVGHQCYAHKLLTGRFEQFGTLRTKGGISGFTNPEESEHDIFYSGHSSTSISAACGLARAKKLKGEKGFVVAVIGDGSLTGGEAYEGLNNAYEDADNLIVIINDNKMSISQNKSSLATSLAKIRSTKRYFRSKQRFRAILKHVPIIGIPIRNRIVKAKYALKGALYHSSFFEDLGYVYLGPVDGHNLTRLNDILEIATLRGEPCVVHVETIKGKGYAPAENDPEHFHGVGPFDITTGQSIKPSGESFSKAFSDTICSFAQKDKRICAVTAAMPTGTGLEHFAEQFENRYFDVGIAEQHAVTFCSGLAKNGIIPIFAVYSTFLQRAYDQLIDDISLQKLKVIFAIDRAGFVGSDGQTHQGLFDIPMLAGIPDINIFAPASFEELSNMMYRSVYKEAFSSAIRYPRGGECVLPEGYQPDGKDYSVFESEQKTDKLIITFGRTFGFAYEAQQRLSEAGIPVNILKLNKIKPIHAEAVRYALGYDAIWFYEESMKIGGIGEHFHILLANEGYKGSYALSAVEDTFVKPAEVSEQFKEFGLDTESIVKDISNG
ncbi:MAG: 1-deoxy-D-xylulose-5-phosphate synthase [Clostridia bacterium]|nr:1-deoxy-D-xylulose-5-phosphate synthase [Clostridia bacterium]